VYILSLLLSLESNTTPTIEPFFLSVFGGHSFLASTGIITNVSLCPILSTKYGLAAPRSRLPLAKLPWPRSWTSLVAQKECLSPQSSTPLVCICYPFSESVMLIRSRRIRSECIVPQHPNFLHRSGPCFFRRPGSSIISASHHRRHIHAHKSRPSDLHHINTMAYHDLDRSCLGPSVQGRWRVWLPSRLCSFCLPPPSCLPSARWRTLVELQERHEDGWERRWAC
jgi:hypothetical protein